ncbi:hypothetical protein CR513_19201, partial [Mucuna pruriens]
MATEIGYEIQKLRPIHARTPDLVSLRQWGSRLKGEWRRTFKEKYGNLVGLLKIKVQPEALSTLTQYYDPPLKCFSFRDFQLAPTLEEYERILGMPLARSSRYLFKGQYPSWAIVAKLLRMSESEIRKEKKSQNGLKSIPRANLEGKLGQLHRQGDWGAFMDVFKLLIYDIVLFPYIKDHIDLAVVDAFLPKTDNGENPTMSKAEWTNHLDEATEKSIRWYPRLNERDDTIFRCGGFPNVPLMGTQGAINYNPELATPWPYHHLRKLLPPLSSMTWEHRTGGVSGIYDMSGGMLFERDPNGDPRVTAPHPVTRPGFETH